MRSRDELAEEIALSMVRGAHTKDVGPVARMASDLADALIARRSPPPAASTPVAYVPKVGDVVKWADGSFPDVEIVIESLRGDGSIEGRELGRDDSTFSWPHARYVKYLRPATSAERIAAGLDKPAPVASEDPRRVVGAVWKWHDEYLITSLGDPTVLVCLTYPLSKSNNEYRSKDVDWDSATFSRWATPDECKAHGIPYVDRSKPVASEARPKFKVGDRVLCVENSMTSMNPVGHVGEITEFDVTGGLARVGPREDCNWSLVKELEPAPTPAATTAEDSMVSTIRNAIENVTQMDTDALGMSDDEWKRVARVVLAARKEPA